MDRLGLNSAITQQVQQRIGGGAVSALPRSDRFRRSANSDHLPLFARNPLADELASLVSSRFLERIAYDRLTHLPRYLKALLIRAERAL